MALNLKIDTMHPEHLRSTQIESLHNYHRKKAKHGLKYCYKNAILMTESCRVYDTQRKENYSGFS